jgi:CRP-like cAMP-binding protein
MARAEELRTIPLFERLDTASCENLAQAANEVEAPAGQALAQPGAAGSGMFFVLEGTVEVQSRETTRELGPGDFFGELALLTDDGTRTARVQAKTPVRCLAFDRQAFEGLIARHPEIAATLLETALTRLADTDS